MVQGTNGLFWRCLSPPRHSTEYARDPEHGILPGAWSGPAVAALLAGSWAEALHACRLWISSILCGVPGRAQTAPEQLIGALGHFGTFFSLETAGFDSRANEIETAPPRTVGQR